MPQVQTLSELFLVVAGHDKPLLRKQCMFNSHSANLKVKAEIIFF